MLLVGRQEGHPACKKTWVMRCWHGYLSGARCLLACAQLMPLPLTVSCFSKIQIGFTFLVPVHPGSPGNRAVKWVCVCACVSVWLILLRPSVLWHCWLGGTKGIRPVKTEWWCAGLVIYLERAADLHTAHLMLLLLTVSCSSKIQIGFTLLVPAYPGSPGQRAVKRACMCVINTVKCYCLQCFDAVGWAAGRASGL